AAAGGVGVAAVQIGKAVGARVIGLASGDKLDVVTAAGADVAIDYRAEDWTEVLARETGPEGINVVIENVGGEVFDECVRRMAWDGRLVVVGFASGKIPELRINRVLLKHISIVGLFWGRTYQHELHTVRSGFRALASLYRQGKLAPLVWKTFPIENVAEALGLLGGRQSVGKIVLTI
ncbi:MAG: zinc-binding dehydrogenase, partial [Candidatus Binatia bacterium]